MNLNLHPRIKDHLLNLAIVSALLLGAIVYFAAASRTSPPSLPPALEKILEDPQFDPDNPLHLALLQDTWRLFYADSALEQQGGIERLVDIHRGRLLAEAQAARKKGISLSALASLLLMFMKFIAAYLLILIISYYGVQTLGLFRFIRWQQDRPPTWRAILTIVKDWEKPRSGQDLGRQLLPFAVVAGKALLKFWLYTILFSPAYVLAYALKTGINTDSFPFLVLLGVISNGMLILYSQKFFTFLRDEHRKGYLETAKVKNLDQSYQFNQPGGIPLRSVFGWRKSFPGHVMEHLFVSARIQYFATLKEQAAFIVTSLAIIEMALNIQGYLCYSLLQNLLYSQYDLVFAILLGLFWIVKCTEIAADQLDLKTASRYENR